MDSQMESQYLDECSDEAIRFDGLDSAIVGTDQHGHLVYSNSKMLSEFVDQGMSYSDAVEWIDYNVAPVMGGQGFTILYS